MSDTQAKPSPENAVAVVVLPSGETGAVVRAHIDRWYQAGLLRPAIWVAPEDVVGSAGEAPRVSGRLLTPDSNETGDLFEMVARRRRQWVRLVLTQVLHAADTVDTTQLAAAEEVRHWLQESLPGSLRRGGADAAGTDLRSVNLVTGVTGLSQMPATLRPQHWDVHVLTSPEDRPSPERSNLFVRSEQNLVPLALISTAVVAGIVPGQVTGAFDQIEGDQSVVLGKARVVRPTVRGLLVSSIVDPIAREAVTRALDSGSPALADPDNFVLGDPHAVREGLLSWIDQLDQGVFAAGTYEHPEAPDGETITVASGAAEAARFVWRALLTLMWSSVHWVRRNVEHVATRAIVGRESGVRLVLHPDVGADFGEQVLALESGEVARRETELAEIARRPARTPIASVWRDLTQVAHGVLDGGTLPHGAPEHREGSRRVLLASAHDVVVDPRDAFEVEANGVDGVDARVLPAWSPSESQRLQADIDEARTSLESEEALARSEVDSLVAQPAEDPDQVEAREAALRLARSRLSDTKKAVRRCRVLQERFDAWLQRRAEGLLWRLGDRLLERRERAAAAEQLGATQATSTTGLDEGAAARHRKRYLVLAWTAVGVATLALLGYYGLFSEGASAGERAAWTGAIISLALLGIVAAALSWFRAVRRILYRYRSGALQRARGVSLYGLARGDRRRLEDVLRQLQQWVALLGWSLHTPWASPEGLASNEVAVEGLDAAEVDGESGMPDETSGRTSVTETVPVLPACFVVGEPVVDDSARAAIVRRSSAWLTGRGWRLAAWRRLVGNHLSPRGSVEPDEIDALLERLERDDGRGPAERERLLAALAAGGPQDAALDAVMVETRAHLRQTRLSGADMTIRHLGGSAGHDVPSDQEFLAEALGPPSPLARETWSAQAQVSGGHEQLTTRVWGSEKLRSIPADGVESHQADRASLDQSGLLDVAVRLDVSRWCDPDELRLFGAPPEFEDPSAFEAVDEDFV